MHIQRLIDFGLTDKEARVYLTLLELGTASPHAVAKAGGLSRSTAYVVLASLQSKGLANSNPATSPITYRAAPPDVLAQKAAKATEQHLNLQLGVEAILPYLTSLHGHTNRGRSMQVRTGVRGLTESMDTALNSSDKFIRILTSGELIFKLIPVHAVAWSLRRLSAGIKIRGIYQDSARMRRTIERTRGLGESAMLKKEDYSFPVDMMIWDDKVGYLISDGADVTSVILESKGVSTITKFVFDMAFQQARAVGEYLET